MISLFAPTNSAYRQARHRVILFGTRSGCGQGAPGVMTPRPVITVDQVLGEMPRIRSGFSSRVHDKLDWKEYVRKAAEKLMLTPEKIPHWGRAWNP